MVLIDVNRAKSMKIYGILYKPGAIIRVKMNQVQDDDVPFQYTLIKDIYIYKHHKLIIGQLIKYIPYSGNVWQGESLANLANHQ